MDLPKAWCWQCGKPGLRDKRCETCARDPRTGHFPEYNPVSCTKYKNEVFAKYQEVTKDSDDEDGEYDDVVQSIDRVADLYANGVKDDYFARQELGNCMHCGAPGIPNGRCKLCPVKGRMTSHEKYTFADGGWCPQCGKPGYIGFMCRWCPKDEGSGKFQSIVDFTLDCTPVKIDVPDSDNDDKGNVTDSSSKRKESDDHEDDDNVKKTRRNNEPSEKGEEVVLMAIVETGWEDVSCDAETSQGNINEQGKSTCFNQNTDNIVNNGTAVDMNIVQPQMSMGWKLTKKWATTKNKQLKACKAIKNDIVMRKGICSNSHMSEECFRPKKM